MSRVAVVVRTKNRHVFLSRALENIFTQSFRDFEVVVVNDGGDPGPVDEVAAGHSAVPGRALKVIHHESSRGMEAASNVGIRATESEFVAIHDDDDLWHQDFLISTVDYLQNRPAVQGVCARTEIIFEELRGGAVQRTGTAPLWPEMRMISLAEMVRVNRMLPISFLYRRGVHEQVGYYDERLAAVGDWEFYLRFLARYEIAFLNQEPLAFWCQRPGVAGELGNSFFAAADDHRHFDAFVRDEYLRSHQAEPDLGQLLFLAQLANQQQAQLDDVRAQAGAVAAKLDVVLARLGELEQTLNRRTSITDFAKRPLGLGKRLAAAVRAVRRK